MKHEVYDVSKCKVIPGLDNVYYADEFGNIYNRKGWKLKVSYVGNPSKTSNFTRYQQITLPINKKMKNCLVHRVIAETFLPNPHNYPQVNHKDGNKSNNSVSNLEWCDSSYNQKHRFYVLGENAKGTKNGRHKLTDNEVIEIYNLMKLGMDYKDIAKEYNISYGTPFDIFNGRSWTHITGMKSTRKKVNGKTVYKPDK